MKLPNTGNKAIIVGRLAQAIQNNDAAPTTNSAKIPTTPSSL